MSSECVSGKCVSSESLPPTLQAHVMLQKEMQVVKTGMGHKELTLAEYSAIWEECYKEVLYVPSQNRYTRASMARNT